MNKEYLDELTQILEKLKVLRKGVAQFVFFAPMFPVQVIDVRKEIIKFRSNPDNNEITEIDFIIHSPGGLADDAYRLIRTLRSNFKTVNVIVPLWAKSAATLFSLGASKIIFDEFGEFGPLDAQLAKSRDDSPELDRVSALNDEHSLTIIENHFKVMFEQMFVRIYEHSDINIPKTELSAQLFSNLSKFFKPLVAQINPYQLGEKKRILDIGAQYAKRILAQFGAPRNPQSARELVDYLVNECPDHGYVVDLAIVRNFVSNIYSSSHFGDEYQSELQRLSLVLVDYPNNETCTGFTDESVPEEQETESKSSHDTQSPPLSDFSVDTILNPQIEKPAPNTENSSESLVDNQKN